MKKLLLAGVGFAALIAGPTMAADLGAPVGPDIGHWGPNEHEVWRGGRWRPYECRFGRCGYWWLAGGYWYFYDHPMQGPPVEVSLVYYEDPDVEPGPPGPVYVSPPGPVYVPPPPPVVCIGPLCVR
jgi:hypothetical protein